MVTTSRGRFGIFFLRSSHALEAIILLHHGNAHQAQVLQRAPIVGGGTELVDKLPQHFAVPRVSGMAAGKTSMPLA